ncbi:DNA-directed RNA polymerase III subunit RPC4 [Orchesella cincta]|uniref:DNA-directed RNA polymerase III subunit RPC4 n=1 Tax=Orchesella cincta TaxID=48709 RepID=A0A1D2MJU3_ORCCI|nr:DNA-directed RNA polymerase III subunit RPC4 [Orchesella cincta]
MQQIVLEVEEEGEEGIGVAEVVVNKEVNWSNPSQFFLMGWAIPWMRKGARLHNIGVVRWGSRYKSATEGGAARMSSLNRNTLNTLIKEEDAESDKKIFGTEKFDAEDEEDVNPANSNVPVILPLSNYIPEYFMEPAALAIDSPPITTLPETADLPTPSTSSEPSTLIPVVKIKQEKPDEDETVSLKVKEELDSEDAIKRNERLLSTMHLESTAFASSFRSTPPEGTLVYFQLPDELPVLEGSVRESVDQQGSSKNTAQMVGDIDDLPEGFIGRLQIMSSGRTRFILGENSFDVDSGRPVGFRQELYAVDEDSATLTNLGPIHNKFVITPDIEYLIEDAL